MKQPAKKKAKRKQKKKGKKKAESSENRHETLQLVEAYIRNKNQGRSQTELYGFDKNDKMDMRIYENVHKPFDGNRGLEQLLPDHL